MQKMFPILALLTISFYCKAADVQSAPTESNNLIASFDEDAQGVTAVAFSPDGKVVAAAGRDGLIRTWRVDKMKLWKILGEHAGWVKCLAFSPDGKMLASAGSDKTIKIWDASIMRPAQTLPGHERGVNSLEFSPDSKILASAGDDQTVRLWDAETGKKIKILGKHKDAVNSVSFYPDGKFLASGGADFKIKIWSSGDWKERAEIQGISNAVEAVAFSPDGNLIAGCWQGTIGVWDAQTGKKISTLRQNTRFKSLSFAPGSSILAAAGTDRIIYIFNGKTGAELRKLEGHAESVEAVAFSPAGRTLVSGGLDSSVKIWDALKVYIRNADTALKNSTGQTLVTLSEGAEVRIEKLKSPQIYVRVKDHLKGWLSETDVTFEKPDLRKPILKMASVTPVEAGLTIRGAAYDDVKVASVFVDDQFFSRKELEKENSGEANNHFGDVFPFEETIRPPAGKPLILKALDEAGREFSVQISTSQPPVDFKPRYGFLKVQVPTVLKRAPARDAPAAWPASPGAALNSIGFKGEWYFLEDGSWAHFLDVQDELAEPDRDRD